jgi:hypothetical protein
LLFVGAIALICMGQTNRARAQDSQFGFDLFQLLLEQKGVAIKSDQQQALNGNAKEKVVVILGNVNGIPNWSWQKVRSFEAQGGMVLIATDQTSSIRSIARIAGGPLSVDNVSSYQNHSDCPIIDRFPVAHPINKGVSQIVANRTGWINQVARRNEWTTIAESPKSSRSPENRFAGTVPLIAVKRPNANGGSIILMGDHSILLNGMLTHGDNALLAMNIADYMCDLQRREIYMIVDGQAVGAKLPQQLPPIRPEDVPPLTLEDFANMPRGQLLNFANTLITELESENVHNELFAEQPGDIEAAFYRQCIYITLGILGILFLLRQIPKGSKHVQPAIRREPTSTSETRINELLYAGNLLPAARELARDFFRTVTHSSDLADWQITAKEVQVEGSFFETRSARATLFRLHRLATRVDRSYIRQSDFQKLAKKIEHLHLLHRQGRLLHPWFDTPDKSPAHEIESQHVGR